MRPQHTDPSRKTRRALKGPREPDSNTSGARKSAVDCRPPGGLIKQRDARRAVHPTRVNLALSDNRPVSLHPSRLRLGRAVYVWVRFAHCQKRLHHVARRLMGLHDVARLTCFPVAWASGASGECHEEGSLPLKWRSPPVGRNGFVLHSRAFGCTTLHGLRVVKEHSPLAASRIDAARSATPRPGRDAKHARFLLLPNRARS